MTAYVAGCVLDALAEVLDAGTVGEVVQTGPDAAQTRVWWDGAWYIVTATPEETS